MAEDILSAAPENSVLAQWADEGARRAPLGSNVVTFVSSNEEYALTVEVDDPIHGYLIRLSLLDEDETRIGQAVVEDRDLALQVAAEMAAAAEDLVALEEDPHLGPRTVYEEDVQRGEATPPEDSGWEDQEDEWNDRLEEAYEEADLPRSKGTLTKKEIDDRKYYYLQWREGEKVRSQYVAPVSPAN